MSEFISWLCCGFIVLPIPIGIVWFWIYKNRRSLGLPDWFSGILAQGIISGHKISQGEASEDDYLFIILATIVTTFLTMLVLHLILALCRVLAGS
jgi:hypothetical protein